MKIHGHKPNAGNVVKLVIPRQNGESMLFIAQGIFDDSEFTKQFVQPQPAQKVEGNVTTLDYKHPLYLERIKAWSKMRTEWIILKSLEATPGLEWETVDMDKPETWGNYSAELKEILMPIEVSKVEDAVMTACALTAHKIEAATQAFLLGQGPVLLNSSSRAIENTNTQSSEPVKDLDSTPSKDGKS